MHDTVMNRYNLDVNKNYHLLLFKQFIEPLYYFQQTKNAPAFRQEMNLGLSGK